MLNPYKVPESVFRKDGKAKISILIVLGFLILHLVVSGLCIQFIYPPLNSYLRYGSGDAAEVVRDFRNYGYFVDSILSLLVCIFATCSVTITSMAMLLKERVVSYAIVVGSLVIVIQNIFPFTLFGLKVQLTLVNFIFLMVMWVSAFLIQKFRSRMVDGE